IKNVAKIKVKVKGVPKIHVQNMVASGSVGMDLNLNKLAMDLENTEYEPEQFPGLVYKLPGTRATFLLFSNGKIVCTGTKSEKDLHAAVDKLIVVLKKFNKGKK
ncbi:TATA-box-binding protein, partial [Candidatus Woesearchaeota archaeon]|nr:TATA-box-binding protein [Candidatus Woesearchaeota archaeon]